MCAIDQIDAFLACGEMLVAPNTPLKPFECTFYWLCNSLSFYGWAVPFYVSFYCCSLRAFNTPRSAPLSLSPPLSLSSLFSVVSSSFSLMKSLFFSQTLVICLFSLSIALFHRTSIQIDFRPITAICLIPQFL